MPELPEVETVARLVRPHLVGRRIEGARVAWTRTLGGLSRARFAAAVTGARIASVGRRAKFVVIALERPPTASRALPGTGEALLVHLRMTGRLHVDDPRDAPRDHVRVELDLDNGRRLVFVDVRKFGRMIWTDDAAEELAHLGPEPLGDAFTLAWLRAELKARRRMLKPLLLDQRFLAGLGNIYVDESLFRARLHPLLRSDRVGPAKAIALHAAIRETLARAIEHEGSSFDTFYRTPEGRPGSYQDQFEVYGRDGKPCRRCGAVLARIVVGQRGTHVCKSCQRAPSAGMRR
jgi:formamidopyrimidine-DNA glycosylase